MATATANYLPVVGRSYTVLSSWAGSLPFPSTPSAGMQIEYSSSMTVDDDGTHGGADGLYTVRLVKGDGTTEAISVQVGVVDNTAPTLSLASLEAAGATTVRAKVTTDEAGGTLYTLISENATELESAVLASGNTTAVLATGEVTVVVGGLAPETTYYAHFLHEDNSGNKSAVVSSASATTDSVNITATVSYQPPSGQSFATLEYGYDRYAFYEWAITDPNNDNDPGYPVAGDQLVFDPTDLTFESDGRLVVNRDGLLPAVFVDSVDGTYTHILVDSEGVIPFDALFPKGVITLGTATLTQTSIIIPFSYSAADATGFEYAIDGGTWVTTTSPVEITGLTAGTSYDIGIRAVNAEGPGSALVTTFTTKSQFDTAPDPFVFAEQTDVARSITITFPAITVKGVDAGVDVPVSISGNSVVNEYSVSTDGGNTWGGWTSTPTNVRLNYQVRVRHTSSDEYSSGGYDGVRETVLNIGGTVGTARSITLADTVPPVITLTGGNLQHTLGEPWVEPGYSAIDNADGDISVTGVTILNAVDVNALGPQQITYRATDRSGNVAEATRIVTVVEYVPDDTVKPVITLTGGNQQLYVGETWTDPGYRAEDDVDGDITDQVQVSGTVDTSYPNTVTLTYTVTDSAGNVGTATRIVTVLSAVDYPMDIEAPEQRTYLANRFARFDSSEPFFIMQSGEVLDYDFDLSEWLDSQGDDLVSGSHDVVELAQALDVEAVGIVTGNQRVKVWLKADTVTDSQSSLVQLKVSTTRSRTAVFQFRVLIINRMQ